MLTLCLVNNASFCHYPSYWSMLYIPAFSGVISHECGTLTELPLPKLRPTSWSAVPLPWQPPVCPMASHSGLICCPWVLWRFKTWRMGASGSNGRLKPDTLVAIPWCSWGLVCVLVQDGGIITNNPTAIALHECRLLWPKEKIQCVVSVGTGKYMPGLEAQPADTSSLKQKLTKIVQSATDTEGRKLVDNCTENSRNLKMHQFLLGMREDNMLHSISSLILFLCGRLEFSFCVTNWIIQLIWWVPACTLEFLLLID